MTGPKLTQAVAWLIAEQLNGAVDVGLSVEPRADGSIAVGGVKLSQDNDGVWVVTVTKPESSDGKTRP